VILLTVYRYKLIRAPFTILPCLAIIGAGGLDDLIRDPPGKNRIRRLIALMLMGLLSIHGYVVLLPLSSLHLIPPWRHEMEYMVNLDPTLETALRTVGDRTNGTADLVICGEFNEVSSLQLSYFLCTSASEILRRVPSLFAWNQPVGSVQLIRMMDDRGYGRCLILSVEPGSMYDTADYREKFAWMSQNMVRPGSDASFTRTWILRFPNGLVAELWERSVKPEHHPVAIRPSGEQSGASGHMREEKPVKSVRLWT
ncbi:hypothetical protein JXA80_06200, partial [bacterium]|nr:hypothetical protein [candidate division CSSED10-310 bacterium]